jgi:GAF domain-containing protein/HAMP domain-containing protein
MDGNNKESTEGAMVAPRQRAIRRGGLAGTLLLVFLPLVVGLLILAGLAGILISLNVAQTRATEQLDLMATLKGNQISNWLLERDRDLAVLVGDETLRQETIQLLHKATNEAQRRAAYAALSTRFNDFWSKKLSYTELFLLDGEEGRVVVTTDVFQQGTIHVDTEYFKQGLRGAYLQPAEFDPRRDVPIIFMARPVLDAEGEPVAVLVGRVNMGDLTVLMQDRSGLGETGETYLVDQDLRSITGLRFGQPGQTVDTVGAARALERKQPGSERYTSYQDWPVFGSYRWIPGLQVALLAERSESEALASVRSVLLGVLGIICTGGLLAAGIVVYVSRRITEPITRLTEAAAEMAAGDLSQRVAVQRPDEIGTLSQAFDDMADRLEEVVNTLEDRVADRTRELQRRAIQLETAADVGRAVASILELDVLVRRIVDLVRERFDLYYAGLFLLDDMGEYAVLEAGTGEPGRVMKEMGHKLEVGGASMVGAASARHQARIALDVGQEAIRFDNPLLPDTRSEMALPLMVGDRVLGALDVQSTQPAAFSEEDIAVLQLVANQVAVAIDNARKFSEEAGLLEATSPLYRVSRRLAASITTDEIVQAIMASVAETEADGCAVGRLDLSPNGKVESAAFLGTWDRSGASPFPAESSFQADSSPVPLEMLSASWSIRDIEQTTQVPEVPRQFLARSRGRAFVNVPLRAGRRVIGFVSIYRATPGRFSDVSVRFYETLVDQAAVALERARLYEDTQRIAVRDRVLSEITDRMRESLDLETILKTAAEEIRQSLGLGRFVVRLATSEAIERMEEGSLSRSGLLI